MQWSGVRYEKGLKIGIIGFKLMKYHSKVICQQWTSGRLYIFMIFYDFYIELLYAQLTLLSKLSLKVSFEEQLLH